MPVTNDLAAAIYVGAYTIQMLIARTGAAGEPETVGEFTAFTRISDHLIETSLLTESGMAAAEKALQEMRTIAEKEGVREFRMAVTSSFRNAANRSSLLLICSRIFGVFPQLLSSKDEARLHFIGTVTPEYDGIPVIVAYIGFNNVPVAFGTLKGIDGVCDVAVGAGPLNRRYRMDAESFNFFGQIPIRSYLAGQFAELSARISEWRKKSSIDPNLFLVGPFPTAYVSLELNQPILDRSAIPSTPHPLEKLVELSRRICSMTPAERRAIPYLDRDFADSLPACAMIQRQIVESCGLSEFYVSPNGLCLGLLKTPADLTAAVRI